MGKTVFLGSKQFALGCRDVLAVVQSLLPLLKKINPKVEVKNMVGGKPWSEEENKLLLSMVAEDVSFQEILDSGEFPGRTAFAIRVQIQRLGASSSVKSEHLSTVSAIKPSTENISMEKVVKLFSSAFEQICESEKIDKHMLERFRIIFQAAKDYVPLLAGYEKWDKIEKQIEELEAAVAEIQSTKGISKTSENQRSDQTGQSGTGS